MTKRRLLQPPADPGAHPSPTQSLRETPESKTQTHTFPPIDKGSQGHTPPPNRALNEDEGNGRGADRPKATPTGGSEEGPTLHSEGRGRRTRIPKGGGDQRESAGRNGGRVLCFTGVRRGGGGGDTYGGAGGWGQGGRGKWVAARRCAGGGGIRLGVGIDPTRLAFNQPSGGGGQAGGIIIIISGHHHQWSSVVKRGRKGRERACRWRPGRTWPKKEPGRKHGGSRTTMPPSAGLSSG